MKNKSIYIIAIGILSILFLSALYSAIDYKHRNSDLSSDLNNLNMIVGNARYEIVEYNKLFEKCYKEIFLLKFKDNSKDVELSCAVLSLLGKPLVKISESLQLDCYKSDEQGNITTILNEDTGETEPLKILPHNIVINDTYDYKRDDNY